MFKGLLSVLFFSFFTLSSAHALVFIEPMVGYATGETNVDASDILNNISASDTFDLKGLNYGIRGGLELGGFQLGLDYIQNNLKASGGSEFELDDDNFKVTELAALIGYRFWFLRLYGGYIFDAKLKDSDADSGKGVKAGITFYALNHLALSLEYRTVELDPFSSDDGFLIDMNYSTTALMLSFPFGV